MKNSAQKLTAKLITLLLVFLLVPALVLVGTAQETDSEMICYEHGDINGDSSVDGRDAIYTLYHILHHQQSANYPVNQDCDFNGDGNVDSADAIYVLYGSMGIFDDYVLCGTVHQYYEPEWSWNEDLTAASVEFRCGCGESYSFDTENGVTVSSSLTEATCTAAGVEKHTASVTFEDKEYTNVQTRVIAAAGHQMTGIQSCTEGSSCGNCRFALAPLDHSWELVEETEATCQTQGSLHYRCQREGCEETKTVTPEGLANHSFTVALEEIHVEGCQYQKQFRCAYCDATEAGEIFYKHRYTAVLTTEASCTADGVMTYVCDCGDSYDTAVSDPNAHNWEEGETDENGVTFYSCANCDATKTALLQEGSEATVSSAALKESELQLSGAIVNLDNDTADALAEEVTISVTTAAVEELSLTEAQAAQIGDNAVYNFTMTSGEEQISEFAGTVTVSVPYTLQEGDDVECIDVWFIADDGTVTCVEGTYRAGFVTFTTNHFSYYTVTRLTAAQRCEAYGHVMVEKHRDATCTKAGYHVKSCQRCGLVETDEILEKLTHTYVSAEEGNAAATCTQAGTYAKICSSCKQLFTGEIPATGHDFRLDEDQSVEATCTEAGREVYVCGHNCGETYTVELSALGHDFGEETTTNPSCTNKGHISHTCGRCGFTESTKELAPHGHQYYVKRWNWAEDYTSATVTLGCSKHEDKKGDDHDKTLEAVVTSTVDAPNCTGSGVKTYTAVASHNRVTYQDTVEVTLEQAGHTPGEDWITDAYNHYKLCSVCGEKVGTASHTWGNTQTIREADCSHDGLTRQTCVVCSYVLESVVPASGQHSYVNGVCSQCDFVNNSCDHLRMYKEDLSANLCKGSVLTLFHCDCGEKYYLGYELLCDFTTTYTENTLPDGTVYDVEVNVCKNCGLTWESSWYEELDPDTCFTAFTSHARFTLDGEVLADVKDISEEGSGYHFCTEEKSSVNMAELGMCGGRIVTYTCPCGEATCTYTERSDCDWDSDFEGGNDNRRVYTCHKCGTVKITTNVTSQPNQNCLREFTTTTVFTKDGQEFYRFSSSEKYIVHEYAVAEEILYGKTCEDGVTVRLVCQNCGDEYGYYADYHPLLERASYSMSDYGMCGGELRQMECPCGKERSYYHYSADGNSCSNSHISTDSQGRDLYQCDDCGSYYLEYENTSPKDDHCNTTYTETCIQYSPDGTLIATVDRVRTEKDHDYSHTWQLKGSSCEDGVRITSTCKDCGYSYSANTTGHRSLILEKYDLADYGMCGGTFLVRGCPCGYYADYDNNSRCNVWNHEEDEHGNSIWVCEDCGIAESVAEGKPVALGNCRYRNPYTATYSRDGETVLEISWSETVVGHRYVWNLTLEEGAADCEDGYYGTAACQACGKTTNTYGSGHGKWAVARKRLSTGVLCGDLELVTTSCACGQIQHQHEEWIGGNCRFGDEVDSGPNSWTSTCRNCGVTKERVYTQSRGENCDYTETYNYTYRKNGTTLFSYADTNTSKRHTYVYSFEMEGDSCEDGYYVWGTCCNCGAKSERDYDTGCIGYRTATEVLYSGSDVCGEIRLNTYSCPCGDKHSQSTGTNCNWEWVGEDGVDDRCLDCGLEYYSYYDYTPVSGTCDMIVDYKNFYTLKGQEIVNKTIRYTQKNHRFVYEFELEGDSCEDGYYYQGTCYYCGAKSERDYDIGCNGYRTATEVLYSGSDVCGEIRLNTYSCPCGDEHSQSISTNCNWEWVGEDGVDDRCLDCGLEYYYYYDYTPVSGTCDTIVDYKNFYTLKGQEIVNKTIQYTQKDHRYVYEFELEGDSCEDGYTCTGTCCYCGATTYDGGNAHDEYRMEYHDLSSYGLCGGYISRYSCACGKESSKDIDYECNWNDTDQTDDRGRAEAYCAECQTYCYVSETANADVQNCIAHDAYNCSFLRDGETLLDLAVTTRQRSHTMVLQSVEFDGEDCDDGLTANRKCHFCDYTDQTTAQGHYDFIADVIDLSEEVPGSCGGFLLVKECACGQCSSISYEYMNCTLSGDYSDSWTEESADGLTHFFYTEVCEDCGMKRLQEYYSTYDRENCFCIGYSTYTFTLGDDVSFSFDIQNSWSEHDYHETDVTLDEGSVTCEDGIIITYTCKYCDDYYLSSSVSHHVIPAGSIDLGQYGSVCGGSLDLYACACGQAQQYDLSEDLKCDLGWYDTAVWIDGYVYDDQYTTEDYVQTYSNAWILRCAVTDPKCDLTIRMAEYWLVEDCIATEYQTWQLGYDEETGTWEKEITLPTGYTHAYHRYLRTQIDELQADGVHVTGTLDTCQDCGSTYSYKNFTDNSGYIGSEEEAVNTLANHEKQYRREFYQYGLKANGYNYLTLERYEYTYADGTDYWYQEAYTYDFTGQCKRTTVYSSSDGSRDEYESGGHMEDYVYTQICDSTCTQQGVYTEQWPCTVCDYTGTLYTGFDDPNDHNWIGNDEDGYVCGVCGMENTNGASGSIVLEDMSDTDNYRVGYWNRGNIMYNAYVSVFLEEKEDEILLDVAYSKIPDQYITGYTFSKAEADSAAQDAVEEYGYDGHYALRFTFVPLNAGDELDYAITFDSLSQ